MTRSCLLIVHIICSAVFSVPSHGAQSLKFASPVAYKTDHTADCFVSDKSALETLVWNTDEPIKAFFHPIRMGKSTNCWMLQNQLKKSEHLFFYLSFRGHPKSWKQEFLHEISYEVLKHAQFFADECSDMIEEFSRYASLKNPRVSDVLLAFEHVVDTLLTLKTQKLGIFIEQFTSVSINALLENDLVAFSEQKEFMRGLFDLFLSKSEKHSELKLILFGHAPVGLADIRRDLPHGALALFTSLHLRELNCLFGFTDDDVHTLLDLSQSKHRYNEIVDFYRLYSLHGHDVFCPFSIQNFIWHQRFQFKGVSEAQRFLGDILKAAQDKAWYEKLKNLVYKNNTETVTVPAQLSLEARDNFLRSTDEREFFSLLIHWGFLHVNPESVVQDSDDPNNFSVTLASLSQEFQSLFTYVMKTISGKDRSVHR